MKYFQGYLGKTCNQCKNENTAPFWCKSCNSSRFQKNFGKWTSGNNDIDEFIREVQLSATRRHKILEWIPYLNLEDVSFTAKGGFGSVYSATWREGSIVYWNAKTNQWKRTGAKMVALKCFYDSQNVTKEFLNEIRNLLYCNDKVSHVTRCYGITRHCGTNEFMIVMQYAEGGNIRNNLSIFQKMSYEDKFKSLYRISVGLHQIHMARLVHRDFHSGNILLSRNNALYITDLGLCKPANEFANKTSNRKIYGVLPYLAPEVLCGNEYTEAADVYAFGVIMSEVFSGICPFVNVQHNTDLAIQICNGLRPKIQSNTPDLVVSLIQGCWNADPSNRLRAFELRSILRIWKGYKNYPNSELAKQIKECENRKQNSLNVDYEKLINLSIYTSKFIDFKNLPEPKNSTGFFQDSKLGNFKIEQEHSVKK